ncbi:hypothetical protein FGADI_12786 [Fusarium gaditjirri]|uniref:Uncharacterized protein n=1 Tax=Fusarium gaditjirri TaxID=282569 RepID=A0A8H4SRC5_9HYPO|nr:hypothetical protein FGADI_12786 [Fusarium gaditjirri]
MVKHELEARETLPVEDTIICAILTIAPRHVEASSTANSVGFTPINQQHASLRATEDVNLVAETDRDGVPVSGQVIAPTVTVQPSRKGDQPSDDQDNASIDKIPTGLQHQLGTADTATGTTPPPVDVKKTGSTSTILGTSTTVAATNETTIANTNAIPGNAEAEALPRLKQEADPKPRADPKRKASSMPLSGPAKKRHLSITSKSIALQKQAEPAERKPEKKKLQAIEALQEQLVLKRELIIEEVVRKHNEYSAIKCKHDEHDERVSSIQQGIDDCDISLLTIQRDLSKLKGHLKAVEVEVDKNRQAIWKLVEEQLSVYEELEKVRAEIEEIRVSDSDE